MEKTTDREKKGGRLNIGITHGDINGIGYEVIIKSFVDQRVMEMCTPIIYGSSKIASYHRKTLNISDFSFNLIRKAEMASPKRPNIINISEQEVKIELGKMVLLPRVSPGPLQYARSYMPTKQAIYRNLFIPGIYKLQQI